MLSFPFLKRFVAHSVFPICAAIKCNPSEFGGDDVVGDDAVVVLSMMLLMTKLLATMLLSTLLTKRIFQRTCWVIFWTEFGSVWSKIGSDADLDGRTFRGTCALFHSHSASPLPLPLTFRITIPRNVGIFFFYTFFCNFFLGLKRWFPSNQ